MVRISVALLFAVAVSRAECPADAPLRMVPMRVLGGPTAPDFVLTVDGKPRVICETTYARMPVSIGLVLDISKSMYAGQLNRRALAVEGAKAFLERSGPQDEFLLAYAGVQAALGVPFTRDRTRVRAGLAIRGAAGGTALIDAMCEALKSMASAHHATRALVVFSDGDDNNSTCSIGEMQAAARANSCPVYLVAPGAAVKTNSFEPDIARDRILPAARETGRHVVFVANAKQAESEVEAISEAIRSPYLLRFAGPTGKVKIEVRGRPRPTLLYRSDPEPSR